MIFISFNLLIARKNYAGKVGKTQIITAHIQIHKHTPDTQGHTILSGRVWFIKGHKHTHIHIQTHKDTHITHRHTYKQTHTHEHTKTHELQSKKPCLDSWFCYFVPFIFLSPSL